jgi:hypothetical protein
MVGMPPALRLGLVGLAACAMASASIAAQGQLARRPPTPTTVPLLPPPADLANGVAVPAGHMNLWVGSDAPAVKPGGHVTLIVEFTPADKVHIYAPGQDTYLPIVFDLKSPSPFVTVAPTTFPPSTSYTFEPTNEKFKVYSSRTRLTRVVTVADVPGLHTDAARTRPFKFTAALRYQACDDRVCFQPNTVALQWTIGLK